MINKPEEALELLDAVASNLVSVEERLVALESHKNAVRENFKIVKEQISEVVERQLANLKSKERQLLRQVELATTHQNCELIVKQAQLSSQKGALSKSRTILDNCSDQWAQMDSNTKNSLASSMDSASDQDLASLLDNTDKLIAAPIVSVSLNETDLDACIKNLGTVSLPCSLPSHDFLPHSACEDYGDMDHHVLYKSLQPDTPRAIDVRKPYLLAVKNKITSVKNNKSEDSKKEELYKWLHHLQLDNYTDSCGEMECCQNSVPCIEEACQANEPCSSFSDCLMGGQCKKSAQEKIDQSRNWIQKQIKAEVEKDTSTDAENSPINSVLKHMEAIMNGENASNCKISSAAVRNSSFGPIKVNPTSIRFAVPYKRPSSDAENSPINSVLNHMDAIMNGENHKIKCNNSSESACKKMKRSDSNLNMSPVKSAVSEMRPTSDAGKSPINSVLSHLDAIMNGANDHLFKRMDSSDTVCNKTEKKDSQVKSVAFDKPLSSNVKNSPINSILTHLDAIMNGENFKPVDRKNSSSMIIDSEIYSKSTPMNSVLSEKHSTSDVKKSPINSILSHMDVLMNGENLNLNSTASHEASKAPVSEKSNMTDFKVNQMNSTELEKPATLDAKKSPINSVLSHLDAIMNGDSSPNSLEGSRSNSNPTFEDLLKMEKERLSNSSLLVNKYKILSDRDEMITNLLNKAPLECTKGQLAMSFTDDLENVKERMEKISFGNHEDKKWLLDMDNKMTEKKIAEEIAKSKDDCNSCVSDYSGHFQF